jgi:hypothetical protein
LELGAGQEQRKQYFAMNSLSRSSRPVKRDGTKSEMIRRLRLANLRKLLRDRNGPILPDDDAGREYLVELLLPISVGPHADIKMPSAIEVWAPWMDKKEAGARLRACQMVRNNRKGRSSVAGFNRPIHYPKLVY